MQEEKGLHETKKQKRPRKKGWNST